MMDGENAVFRSLDMIERRIADKLTVNKIAESVHFSRFHYGRLFRDIVGDSVMEYVTKRKLSLAGRALLESTDTVLDIALRFGYASHEGFTRGFKAYMGVTPTEYRRYRLSAISQKAVRERLNMTYTHTTDGIIRELNGFIADARETASQARKNGAQADHAFWDAFWHSIADATDAMADKLTAAITRVDAIAEKPDEITNRFIVLKAIEDTAFTANLTAFNVSLMVSRGYPEQMADQKPLCDMYVALARASAMKAERITGYMNDLAALILADMRKNASDRVDALIQKGNAALEGITGYAYIKQELAALVKGLAAAPREDITVSLLEDLLFKLNIIVFAADMDAFRMPPHRAMFGGINAFKDELSCAIAFFETLIRDDDRAEAAPEPAPRGRFLDIIFQINILFFYTKGEAEKMGALLNGGPRSAYDAVCGKIGALIKALLDARDDSGAAYGIFADRLYEIRGDMLAVAESLQGRGSAVAFLAGEFGHLADNVTRLDKPV